MYMQRHLLASDTSFHVRDVSLLIGSHFEVSQEQGFHFISDFWNFVESSRMDFLSDKGEYTFLL
jgi:hypothetical protein